MADVQVGLPVLPEIETVPYFALLNQWLQQCDKSHPQCLREPSTALKRPPTRLIDVSFSTVRLVVTTDLTSEQLSDLRYFALSHPWGSSLENTHFCTTAVNVQSRINFGIETSELPDTFQDAVRVTRSLRLRYLWIDSLCIIQGPGGDFEREAKHMETVFSQAYCVIAASRATGTSSGFLSKRSPREFVTLDGTSGQKLFVCEAIDNFQQDVIDGPLNKRGWVLQERALARRTIYFTDTQTYWECGAGVHCETLTKMTKYVDCELPPPITV